MTTNNTTPDRKKGSRKKRLLMTGSIIGTLAIVGSGTGALLSTQHEEMPHVFTSGEITLGAISTGHWTLNGETVDLTDARVVPGDVLEYVDSSFEVELTGNTLRASARYFPQASGVGSVASDLLDASTITIDLDGDGAPDGFGDVGEVLLEPIGSGETRTVTLNPHVTIELPWDSPFDNVSALVSVSIKPRLEVKQVRPDYVLGASSIDEGGIDGPGEDAPSDGGDVVDGALVTARDGNGYAIAVGSTGVVTVGDSEYIVTYEDEVGPGSVSYARTAELLFDWSLD